MCLPSVYVSRAFLGMKLGETPELPTSEPSRMVSIHQVVCGFPEDTLAMAVSTAKA
ncbi:hypothetical protein PDE_05192 [Penicillium oxalicum 114-2]|uniref:Uncharacterized protein n=1 Tax=Penicillium oxalicum (strain 114-2 / CGMCC 5302) TaxID=933388 RepID=S8B6G2_PENO1|nr:hypothetical protein PDE_05192 [Penicillium oxalicum 114-2]